MFKILADACIHSDLVGALREAGFDVLAASQVGLSRASDEKVFKSAVVRKRILLTFDRGFGDIFRFDISGSPGVVILLINQMTKEEIINLPLAFFTFWKNRNFRGKLAIIGKRKIRISER